MATTAQAPRQSATTSPPARRAGDAADQVLLPWTTRSRSISDAMPRPCARSGATIRKRRGGADPRPYRSGQPADFQAPRRAPELSRPRRCQRAEAATSSPRRRKLQRLVEAQRARAQLGSRVEKIWDFYFELFGQRQSRYANWLLSCDRIALDCYRAAYLGLGVAKSIPAPPPFSYMRTGFSPATFRRGIPLTKLGKQLNPFPLVELPYHRLVNPWTLGAVLHEISHNLQSDLGLSKDIPAARSRWRLMEAGISRPVVFTWARWNREMFADMSALLLGGPGSCRVADGRDRRGSRQRWWRSIRAASTRRPGCACSIAWSCCGAWALRRRPTSTARPGSGFIPAGPVSQTRS